jgi:hypothetical protein
MQVWTELGRLRRQLFLKLKRRTTCQHLCISPAGRAITNKNAEDRPLVGAVVARFSKENSAVAQETKGRRAVRSFILLIIIKLKGVGDAFGRR